MSVLLPYLIYAGVFLAGQWLHSKGIVVPVVGPPAPAPATPTTTGPFATLLHNVLSSQLVSGTVNEAEQAALQTLLGLVNAGTVPASTVAAAVTK